ncbi:hypothetical protein SAY86_030569 [Trapa natans]|uniref:Protein BIC1 n=1 Tax=Trapa natans TaxID=22666 RepID=A0AAN7RIK6_TRANT|nr:hypothetical protein SAY86_030569 [Trapa natans]
MTPILDQSGCHYRQQGHPNFSVIPSSHTPDPKTNLIAWNTEPHMWVKFDREAFPTPLSNNWPFFTRKQNEKEYIIKEKKKKEKKEKKEKKKNSLVLMSKEELNEMSCYPSSVELQQMKPEQSPSCGEERIQREEVEILSPSMDPLHDDKGAMKEHLQPVLKDENGRERLKRHRTEVAGQVWIPDIWGQEDLLMDWVDCSSFDSSLAISKIMSARAALVNEGRLRTNSIGFRNSCWNLYFSS